MKEQGFEKGDVLTGLELAQLIKDGKTAKIEAYAWLGTNSTFGATVIVPKKVLESSFRRKKFRILALLSSSIMIKPK